jgi:mitochondrial pyruvate carrier 2
MATGAIWTRWCFIIKPRNIFLATVNFFLFCTGAMQVTRIQMHQRSLKQGTTTATLAEEVKGTAKELEDEAKAGVEKAKQALK